MKKNSWNIGNWRYIKYFWEPFTGTNIKAVDRQKSVDPTNYQAIAANLRDFKEFKGKYYKSAPALLEHSINVPSFSAQALNKNAKETSIDELIKNSRVSLLIFAFREPALEDAMAYRKAWELIYPRSHDFPAYTFLVTDNPIMKPLKGIFRMTLRSKVDPALHDHLFTRFGGGFETVRLDLGMKNVCVPWVYLVKDGQVHWKCHAHPTSTELDSLSTLSQQLLLQDDEIRQKSSS